MVWRINMPYPRKYPNPREAQRVYRQTEKGKATEKRYRSSEKAKQVRREWWRNKYGKTPLDPQQYFIDTYGDPVVALELLNQKEKLVIKYLYGLDGGPPLTQEAIASMMECSHQWISQLKKQAEKKLAPLKKAIDSDTDPEK